MAVKTEPKIIAALGPGQNASVGLGLPKRMFNADLARLDDLGKPQPYLAHGRRWSARTCAGRLLGSR